MTRPPSLSVEKQRQTLRLAVVIAQFAAAASEPYELDDEPMRRVRIGDFVAFISAHCAEAAAGHAVSEKSFQLMIFPRSGCEALLSMVLHGPPCERLHYHVFRDGAWLGEILQLLSPDRTIN